MASTRNSNPPADLVARASAHLVRFFRSGDRVVAALSGGVDSVFLLHVLRKLSGGHEFHLSALHVNHGINTNADHWQAFCERLCDAWQIRLDVKRVVVVDGDGDGLEAAARGTRYDAFAEVDSEWLVLAHHRDDQAETLLFNLLRGTGIGGAAAMPMARVFPGRPGLSVLRPLLDTSREEILVCARAEGLSWIDDESNSDVRFSRNFLRHRILPLLRERFPGCDAVLARAASHFSESEELLHELARSDAEKVMREGRIITEHLAKLDDARARNLLRYVLRLEGVVMPASACLHEIVRQLCFAEADRHLNFNLGRRVLHRFRGEVWLIPHVESGEDRIWRGEDSLKWGSAMLNFKSVTGAGISRGKLTCGCVRIAPRRGGERLRPDGDRPRKTLKNLMQERAIPPWERGRLPLLWCGNDLVWAAGIGIDANWQCSPEEPGILPDYLPILSAA